VSADGEEQDRVLPCQLCSSYGFLSLFLVFVTPLAKVKLSSHSACLARFASLFDVCSYRFFKGSKRAPHVILVVVRRRCEVSVEVRSVGLKINIVLVRCHLHVVVRDATDEEQGIACVPALPDLSGC
jgi:hypothetical protein